MKLENKVVLVTGSSQGIGRDIALAFAREKSRLIITYHANKAAGNEVLKGCRRYSDAKLVKLDITSDKSIISMFKRVAKDFGKVDILINNAGIIHRKRLAEMSGKEISEQIETNLSGLIKTVREGLKYFPKDEKAIIINIGSGAGKKGYADMTVYCATKFGVRGFTQSLAEETGRNIQVYCVNPGTTATRMNAFKGRSPTDVAKIVIETAKGNLRKESGSDIDVWEY